MAPDNIEASLQPGLILRMSPADFASHLRALVASAPADQGDATVAAITSQLQSHVHSNAIPPMLFSIWLPMALAHLPQLLGDVLGDKESSGMRKAGTRQLRRIRRGRNWSENEWKALGGIEGVRSLFNNLSVSDVRPLVMAISVGARTRGAAGDEAVDHILEALTDGSCEVQRLELNDIASLLVSCSTPFVTKWLSKKPLTSFPLSALFKWLVRSRPDLARNIATGAAKVHPKVRSSLVTNPPAGLIWSPAPYKPKYTPVELSPKSPPGMRFCFDLLHSLRTEPMSKTGPSAQDILKFVQIAENQAIRHKTPFDDILSLVQVGLDVAELHVEKLELKLTDLRLVVLIYYWSMAKYPDYIPDCSINHKKGSLSAASHPSRPNAKHQADLETLIVHIIKSAIPYSNVYYMIHELFELLPKKSFAPTAGLPLLKLLYCHIPTVRVDLDSPHLNDEEWRRIDLDAAILTKLPSSDSKWLFGRRPNLLGAGSLITFHKRGSPWTSVDTDSPWWFKHGLLKIMWEVNDAQPRSGSYETLKFLENVKTEAEKSRDPDIRASWALRAAEVAVTSNSVAIMRDVTVWSRRYQRDHKVYPVVTEKLQHWSAGDVLSCVMLPPNRRPASLLELKVLVDEANSILSLHIEAAVQYLREPSFTPSMFISLDRLLREVLDMRIDGVQTLRKLGLGSESELASILIESMMSVLMLYEETALVDGNGPLRWDTPNGPLRTEPIFSPRRLFALPFLDNLAKRRDELWAQARLKRNDLVATLDRGWPRGLPIQYLLPGDQWIVQALANPEAAPFVAERVRNVVFCDAETALVPIPHNTEAIGLFVDKLDVAIRSYVGSGSSAGALGRIERVWEHYSHVVPAAAGHIEFLKSLLKDIASSGGIKWLKEDAVSPLPPSVPVSENNFQVDLEPTEWDPRPNGGGCDEQITENNEVDEKPQNLLLSRVSATKSMHYRCSWYQQEFSKPVHSTLTKSVDPEPGFWRTWINEIHKLPMSSRDALVVSAMLYLDAFVAGNSRLLSNQFPARALHPRYPPMYLDYEFLSSAGKSSNTEVYIKDAILALRKLRSIVPPLLLRDLANSMLNKLVNMGNDEHKHQLESATFKIISLLSHSDQPYLASDLGLKVIERMPDSSSWHRRVISVGLCKRLTSTQVKEMLHKFSQYIVDSLKRQHAGHETEKVGHNEDHPKCKYAKVTTMKLLVELLENGDLVSSEISLDILRSLFVTSNHIDVKAAALRAIRDLLGKSVRLGLEPDLKVYKTFTSFAYAATGPDERSVVSEAEWLAAENGGPLPNCDNKRPLLELFLWARSRIPKKFHEDYVSSVLLKILDESTKHHTRWMRIFLGRYNLSAKEASFASFGPFEQIFHSYPPGVENFADKLLLEWPEYISKDYLLLNRELSLSLGYRDCEKHAHINKKITAEDPTLWETNAGDHWRHYLETHTEYRSAFEPLGRLMRQNIQPRVPDGVTLEDVEEEYFQRVAIAARDPRCYKDGDSIVSLEPFEYAISLLVSPDLHTKIRPDESSERPPLLPSLWNLRCKLAMTSPLIELVERVNSLCEECAQSSFAMGQYQQLVNAVSTIPSDSKTFLLVKLGVAAQNQHDTFAGCIKAQLVHHLLQGTKTITAPDMRMEVQALLASWLDSTNDNIRRLAFGQAERFSKVKAKITLA
ncbi:hypothetical protein VE04_09451 [Pseudogymnoascus sp. 24MN13]|nr:hypothetical protein VE04_09451 [Pseudogymnoascus sp. 24MN13]